MLLRIEAEQFAHFANIVRRRFVTMISDYYRAVLRDEVSVMDAAQLEVWVSLALAVCERAAVTTEPEAAQLIALLLVLGVDAEERHDWVPPIVARRGLTAEGKVRAFLEGARERGLPVDRVLLYPQYEVPNAALLGPQEPHALQQEA